MKIYSTCKPQTKPHIKWSVGARCWICWSRAANWMMPGLGANPSEALRDFRAQQAGFWFPVAGHPIAMRGDLT